MSDAGRGWCEIILCEDATRPDRGRLFVDLTRDALAELRRDLAGRAPNGTPADEAVVLFARVTLTRR